MRRVVTYAAVFGLIFAIVVLVFLRNTERPADFELSLEKSTPRVTINGLKGEVDIQNAFIKAADEVGSAVVAIATERTQKVGFKRPQLRFRGFGGESPFGGNDPFEKFFEDFFGQAPEREFKQRGLGTGFIIDKNGHILTNHHVIADADEIMVDLPDGRSFKATVKGSDPRSDLAIVKIDAKDLPIAKLGNSDLLQVGEWVVALGNPFGHILKSSEPTVTVGVVSALHRRLPTAGPGGQRGYLDMIQTDAAINPGNSGGPLCDLNGEVIGINVVIFSTSGGYQGIGFAIPINLVKDILSDLITGKEIAYGWLGVSIQEITPDLAKYFNLEAEKGALISEIFKDSPAEAGGLKPGDIITHVNGTEIIEVNDLLKEVSRTKVGKTVDVDVLRDGVKKTIKVKVGKRPTDADAQQAKEPEVKEDSSKWRGIRVAAITDDIARQLGLTSKEGVVVTNVERDSSAYRIGLSKGSVIRAINKIAIKSLEDYKNVIKDIKGLALVRTDRGYFTIN